jgi:hypothetical protein
MASLPSNHIATRDSDELGTRINELGNKSTQLLLFLTFAILGAVTLMTRDCASQQLVRAATWWWMSAVFPVLLGVLPVKDFRWNNRTGTASWSVRVSAPVDASVILSGIGAIQFLRAMS